MINIDNLGRKIDVDPRKLIEGKYEKYTLPEDLSEQRAPDYGHNILNWNQCLYDPIADWEHLQRNGKKPEWPGEKPFAVCLTHDVDHVSKNSLKQIFRRTKQRVAAPWQANQNKRAFSHGKIVPTFEALAQGAMSSTQAIASRGEDPFHNLEKWLEVERGVGAKSTFFFMPTPTKPYHISDPEYRLSDKIQFENERCTVADAIQKIDSRGWEIGLHPTWYSYNDASKLSIQKEELEGVIGHEIKSIRQHYLHYDIRETPKAQEKAGFSFDTSLGFNKNIGFRFGSSYPWKLYNLSSGEQTDLMEVPLIIQDVALFRGKGLGIDEDLAFKYVKIITNRIKETGGVLTLLWHPSRMVDTKYWSLYKRILEYLDEQNAWFGTVSQIGEWWKNFGPEHALT